MHGLVEYCMDIQADCKGLFLEMANEIQTEKLQNMLPDKTRAKLNRTLTLNHAEAALYATQLVHLEQKVEPDKILDKTINQDLFAVLHFLPATFVDLLFIDPPYNLTKNFNGKTFSQMDVQKYSEWLDSWLSRLLPALKQDASVYICGDWLSSTSIFAVASKYFKIRNRITWEREKGRGAKSNWKNSSEDIWFCTLSESYTFNVDRVKLKKRVIAPYRDHAGKPKDWDDNEDGKYRLTHPSNLWTDLTVPFGTCQKTPTIRTRSRRNSWQKLSSPVQMKGMSS